MLTGYEGKVWCKLARSTRLAGFICFGSVMGRSFDPATRGASAGERGSWESYSSLLEMLIDDDLICSSSGTFDSVLDQIILSKRRLGNVRI